MYTPPADSADEPEHVARYLSEPLAATWRAFDRGRAAAEDFFADKRRRFNPHLWAHIARYEAVLSIESEHTPTADWDYRKLPHSGIELIRDPFRARVLKAFGGGPPHPGGNRARRAFFQQLGLTLFSFDSFGDLVHGNLIVYWRPTADHSLDLGLCKPRGLWQFKGQPKVEWRQPVTFDPFAGLSFPAVEDDDLHVGLRFDLSGSEEEQGG